MHTHLVLHSLATRVWLNCFGWTQLPGLAFVAHCGSSAAQRSLRPFVLKMKKAMCAWMTRNVEKEGCALTFSFAGQCCRIFPNQTRKLGFLKLTIDHDQSVPCRTLPKETGKYFTPYAPT